MTSRSGFTYELPDNPTGFERVLGAVSRLNGRSRSALIVYRIPERMGGASPLNVEEIDEYLQLAGDSTKMTIEQRTRHGGMFRHVVIGRPGESSLSETAVEWQGASYAVFHNEVFDSSEAVVVVTEYLRYGSVSQDYLHRPI